MYFLVRDSCQTVGTLVASLLVISIHTALSKRMFKDNYVFSYFTWNIHFTFRPWMNLYVCVCVCMYVCMYVAYILPFTQHTATYAANFHTYCDIADVLDCREISFPTFLARTFQQLRPFRTRPDC
jgi:hypothetical protein